MHPKIPEHPRFRHNAETGEDEFLIGFDTIEGPRGQWSPVSAEWYPWVIQQCGKAACAEWDEKAITVAATLIRSAVSGQKVTAHDRKPIKDARKHQKAWAAWAKKSDEE